MWQEFETGVSGCYIFLKIDTRKVELEFKGMGPRLAELNTLLCNLQLPTAIRTNKGRSASASIQFEIAEEFGLSFYSPFFEQENRVVVWLNKAVEMMKIVDALKNNGYKKFPL